MPLQKLLSFSTLFIALAVVSLFSFKSAENFGKIFDGYKADELKYFSEVAFLTGKLSRWEEPVRISQEGYSAKDVAFMNNLLNEIQPLLSSVPVSFVPSGGNVVIHHSQSVAEYAANYTGSGILPLGYAIPKLSGDNALIHADVYLHPSLLNDKKNEVLVHEICHTLGLLGHPSSAFAEDNIMGAASFKNKTSYTVLPRLDKAALKLLYDKRMPKNLLKADFLKKLSSLTVKIN